VSIIVGASIFQGGIASAYLRLQGAVEYSGKEGEVLWTTGVMLAASACSSLLLTFVVLFSITAFVSDFDDVYLYIQLIGLNIFLRLFNDLFLMILRAHEQAVYYATANLLKFFLMLVLNVYFVVFKGMGADGILYAFLAGEILLTILLLPSFIKNVSVQFDLDIARNALIFGLPLIFTQLAGMLLSMGDRFLLASMVSLEAAGIYGIAYAISGSLNAFIIQPFTLGFYPQSYKMYGSDGDKRFFSKMQTYLVLVVTWVALGLAFFTGDLLSLVDKAAEYSQAASLLPLLLLTHVLIAARAVAVIGLLLKKTTNVIAKTVMMATGLNLLLNFLLIPFWGMKGAVIATLMAYILLYCQTYYYSQEAYKLPFQNRRMFKILLLAGLAYFAGASVTNLALPAQLAIKFAILGAFPFLLYAIGVYEDIEVQRVREGLSKLIDTWRKRNS
jgi:O-antigen/teichoic acid export membrane protein